MSVLADRSFVFIHAIEGHHPLFSRPAFVDAMGLPLLVRGASCLSLFCMIRHPLRVCGLPTSVYTRCSNAQRHSRRMRSHYCSEPRSRFP